MVSSELGTCEWFVWDLRRSGLIDRGQLDQVIGEFLKRNPRAEPPAMADYLVSQGVLSPFQAERILSGKTQGLVLGPYILVDSIGSGSMGQVYKATSKTDNQWYAVKVLPRRSMWNVRLARRQVRAFSQLSHPGVVPFVDVGTSGGLHYLVWPFSEGETLEARVSREGKMPANVVARCAYQVAQALNICHQNGIFHGLIKPSNIMLGKDGQTRVLDFGIGSLLVENDGESLVDTMSTANTLTSGLDCSSPESIMEPTNRTPAGDQYSLGCVIYFALAGRYPFADGTAVEKMMAHQSKQPTPLRELVAGIPEGLIEIVERLMQKSPEARFVGADDIVEALQPFINDPVSNPKSGFAMPASQPGTTRTLPDAAHRWTPMPGSSGLPLPKTLPGSPVTTSMESTPTLPTSRKPVERPLSTQPPNLPLPTMPKPVLPSRYSVQTPTVDDQATVPAPIGEKSPTPPAPPSVTPASSIPTRGPVWTNDAPPRGGFGPLMIVAIGALIVGLVYILGKSFLFPNP